MATGQKDLMQSTSRRAALKAHTSFAHEALDKVIGPLDTAASYRSYLVGMVEFRSAVETMLAQAEWPAGLRPWHGDRLTQLIAEDIADLNADMPLRPASMKTVSRLGVEELLGVLYVLEGSALGAQLLYRRAQSLGYGETYGARHLAVQCGQKGRWGDFLRLLEDVDGIDIAIVAKASTQTFQIAKAAFERANHGQA